MSIISKMKFTEDQIDFVTKILMDEDVDDDIISKIKEKMTPKTTAKTSTKSAPKSKSTETCIAMTKANKRCSKTPAKGEQMCSIHLKKSSDTASIKSEESIPEVDKMTKEEKKRQIELIFDENK